MPADGDVTANNMSAELDEALVGGAEEAVAEETEGAVAEAVDMSAVAGEGEDDNLLEEY